MCSKSIFYSINYVFFFSAINSIASHIVVDSVAMLRQTMDTYCRRRFPYTRIRALYNVIVIIKCKSLLRSLNPNTRCEPFRCVSNGDLMLLRVARTRKLSLSTAYNVILWLCNFHKNLITFSVG